MKITRKKALSLLMCLVLAFTMLPVTALAAGVDYVDENGQNQTFSDVITPISESTTNLTNGCYVVNNDVTLNSSLIVQGDVKLILSDSCTLTVNGSSGFAGISVPENSSLSIYGQSAGTGELVATGGTNGAGIGGSYSTSGTVVINGGMITAQGGQYSAAIGGGGFNGDGGTIQFNGGTVHATGGENGAGIGGGRYGDGGAVTINGGTVTAIGGSWSAGIGGGGYNTIGGGASGTIEINGGEVHATADSEYGAGIGSGGCGDVNTITIHGGNVTALGGNQSAGIGGSGKGSRGQITISGGEVNATGGSNGAGIGSGAIVGGSSDLGSIIISGGTVISQGGYYAAGIGGGVETSGGTIMISGGTVTSTGDFCSAGIGGGWGGSGGNITISGGTVTSTGGNSSMYGTNGAGIGGGSSQSSKTVLGGGTVTIIGGSINASSIFDAPTNGEGANVYLNPLTISGQSNQTLAACSIGGVPCAEIPDAARGCYGIHDILTDDSGKLYFYLPVSTGYELVSATVVGTVYQSSYQRTDSTINNTHTLFSGDDLVVSQRNIAGVTVPALDETPASSVTETEQYTGTVAWSPSASIFGGNTIYTATITLEPKSGYTLTGVEANYFAVAGATSVSNEADSGIITAVFPATEYDTRSSEKAITGFSVAGANGTINNASHSISILLPYGTNVTSLTPMVTVSNKASILPASGTAQDFTSPVTYTVTAENGTTQNYTVTVTTTAPSDTALYDYAVSAVPANNNAGTYTENSWTEFQSLISRCNLNLTAADEQTELDSEVPFILESISALVPVNATPLTANGSAISGEINTPTTINWYRLDAQAGQTYTILTSDLVTNSSEDMDTVMYLYDTDSISQLDFNDDNDDNMDRSSAIQFSPLTSGTYYIKVLHYDYDEYLYNRGTLYDSIGTYHIAVNKVVTDATLYKSVVSALPQNNNAGTYTKNSWAAFQTLLSRCDLNLTAADGQNALDNATLSIRSALSVLVPVNATPLTANGAAASGEINIPTMINWYRFDALAGQTYTIQMSDLTADMVMYLYDSDSVTQLDDAETYMPGSTELEFSPLASGTYYVEVLNYEYNDYLYYDGSFYDTSVGTYHIAVTEAADTLAPIVSNISSNGASIRFSCSEAGNYYCVVYENGTPAPDAAAVKGGITGTAGASALNYLRLDGLTPNTAYTAYIMVADAAGNTSAVIPISITTLADTTKPVISNASRTETGIQFTSSETGLYFYEVYIAGAKAPDVAELTSFYRSPPMLVNALEATNITISGLAASTDYKAYVIVIDASGNMSEITAIDFTTPAKADDNSEDNGGGSNNGSTGGGTNGVKKDSSAKISVTTSDSNKVKTVTATLAEPGTVDQADDLTRQTVADSSVDSLIGYAKEAEKQGATAVIRIEVKPGADTTATIVTIPQKAFKKIADTTKADVTISTDIGTVTFDAAAVSSIRDSSSAGDFSLKISRVKQDDLPDDVKAEVNGRPVYDFSVAAGSGKISSFGGGSAEVSIPYTLGAGEDASSVVVYYIDDSGKLVPVQGMYDDKTKTVKFTTTHFSQFMIGYNKVTFADVPESAWYFNAVTFCGARGITNGASTDMFAPGSTLTRAQFVVMLLRAYGISPAISPADNFADAGDTYYTNYLAEAKQLGISKGMGENLFNPDKNITRQEMFTLLYNALKAFNRLPDGTSGKTLSSFSDSSEIAFWAKDAMTLMVETEAISGSGGKLTPSETTTRAEMAQVLYKLLTR